MDATFFEITIKAIIAGVTLFILVRYIFFLRCEGFWSFVFPSSKKDDKHTAQPPKVEPQYESKADVKADNDSIVGNSKTVYIDKPVSLKPTPHRSEELEREALPDPEAEPTADEVDDTLGVQIQDTMPELDPDEMYIESATGEIDNGEFTMGVTFEQIANAYEVAGGMEVDDKRIEEAVDTFYVIRGNNFCDFIVAHSERLFAIDKMLTEHVENDGTLIKHLKSRKLSPEIVNFDISRYE